MYGKAGLGTWIDGAFGTDHAMAKMAVMLRAVDTEKADDLIDEYENGEIADEDQDEWLDDATDELGNATKPGFVWEWDSGDLVLREEEQPKRRRANEEA